MEHMDVNPMGLDGFEFCEFTAPDTAALRRQFEALGFVAAATHPTRRVTRYVQGRTNLLVNEEPGGQAAAFAAEHGPSANGMAFRVADAQAAVAGVRLPAGSYLEWGGQFENLESASQRLKLVVPACFVLILLLLYGALGSVRDAAIVFTGVPFALVGGVLLLFVRGMDFSISAAVGFIALSGIAVLNGLVMVSSVQELIRSGMDRAEAARTGALQRLRPVVMTALVASR